MRYCAPTRAVCCYPAEAALPRELGHEGDGHQQDRAFLFCCGDEISRRRAPVARAIYEQIGGGSPLLANTQAQAAALESQLGAETRVFIAMRYWIPLSDETVREVASYRPDQILLLPLYPQLSAHCSVKPLLRSRNGRCHNGSAPSESPGTVPQPC